MNFLERMKPGVRKRTLLLIAGCAWTIAGGILVVRSLAYLIGRNHHLALELSLGIVFGILFFFLLFSRISKKHIHRILLIETDHPCFFSFFNFRSYLLMTIMISGGVLFRLSGLASPDFLYTFLLIMGIPLLVSAYRFFYSFAKNKHSG